MIRITYTILSIFIIVPLMPWWTMWIILAIYGWNIKNIRDAIISGIGISILIWGTKIGLGYYHGGDLLIKRVSDMMNIGSPLFLIIISLALSGILGALSSMSGYSLKKISHTILYKTTL